MQYLIQRLSEVSTWAGLATLGANAAHAWATKDPAAVAAVLVSAAAIIAPEKKAA